MRSRRAPSCAASSVAITSATLVALAALGLSGVAPSPTRATRAVVLSAEPVVRRVVEREGRARDVDVREAEASPDDRVRDLGHRGRALDDRAEPDPEEHVVPREPVDAGRKLEPIDALPEGQLLRASGALERPGHAQALTDRRRLGDDLRPAKRRRNGTCRPASGARALHRTRDGSGTRGRPGARCRGRRVGAPACPTVVSTRLTMAPPRAASTSTW